MQQHLYTHLFFDLDRTLWDLEANSEEVLRDMYKKRTIIHTFFSSPEEFVVTFKRINDIMWCEYHRGNISKKSLREQRFYLTLRKKKISNRTLAQQLDEEYIAQSPTKTALMPYAIETLQYLQQRGYRLHIITNGFNDVQYNKLFNSKLDVFFETVTTSENAACQKPNLGIYQYAGRTLKANVEECLMIGDDFENDIRGAMNMGWSQVYYNPNGLKTPKNSTYEIKCLSQLIDFL
ncbi:MAG: YjjG family noncanonical pyrimidine nucleotidase [Bacteroidales bacterium]